MAQLIPTRICESTAVTSRLRGGAVAIGNFDGVHIGHATLVRRLVQEAKRVGGPATVITFDPPPATVLHPDKPPVTPLTTLPRRAELLGQLGVDAVLVLRSEADLLELSAQEFFHRLIVESLSAKAMVEGPNFRFGKQRLGDTGLLQALCDAANIRFSIVRGQLDGDLLISSTRIRAALLDGDIGLANSLLTSAYRFSARVVNGEQRGRELGFPTANFGEPLVLLPKAGVYGGEIAIDGDRFRAAVNIGANPTFGDAKTKVEAHIIDYDGDLYGRELTCTLLQRIRDVKKFESIEQLRKQIEADVAECRELSLPALRAERD